MIYRKNHTLRKKETKRTLLLALLVFITLLLSSLLTAWFNFKFLSQAHTPNQEQFYISQTTWWEQEKPLLPLYQLDRIGKKMSLLNIQFTGDLTLLADSLKKRGWKSHEGTFFSNLLMRMSEEPDAVKLPLFTQLYANKTPALIMTWANTRDNTTLELRIWESNYTLIEHDKPVWIGSIHPGNPLQINRAEHTQTLKTLLSEVLPKEKFFKIRRIKLPEARVKSIRYFMPPYLILIQNH